MHRSLPAVTFTAMLSLRAAGVWVGVRTMVALFGSLAGIPPLPSAPRDVVMMVLVVTALAAMELRRRRELLFFANLGIAPAALVSLGGAVALLLELALVAAKVMWS